MLPFTGTPDYYTADFGAEGEVTLGADGVGINPYGGGNFWGGGGTDGVGFDTGKPGDDTPVVDIVDEEIVNITRADLPLAECDYFMYGGESLSPYNSATN